MSCRELKKNERRGSGNVFLGDIYENPTYLLVLRSQRHIVIIIIIILFGPIMTLEHVQ